MWTEASLDGREMSLDEGALQALVRTLAFKPGHEKGKYRALVDGLDASLSDIQQRRLGLEVGSIHSRRYGLRTQDRPVTMSEARDDISEFPRRCDSVDLARTELLP